MITDAQTDMLKDAVDQILRDREWRDLTQLRNISDKLLHEVEQINLRGKEKVPARLAQQVLWLCSEKVGLDYTIRYKTKSVLSAVLLAQDHILQRLCTMRGAHRVMGDDEVIGAEETVAVSDGIDNPGPSVDSRGDSMNNG